MNRTFVSLASLVAAGLFLAPVPAPAQQQGQPQQQQQQDQAVGAAAVRTRENAQTIQLDQHQSPVIAVLYGQQPSDMQIVALVTHPDAPQQDKEIVFNRANSNKRIIVHEGDRTGQPRRIVLIARRGQEDAQIEKITENQGVCVFGVRKPEPKQPAQQAQSDQQQQQQQQANQQAQDPAAQQAAQQQQDPAAAAQQAAAKQKAAEEEAKRKAAEPKPDVYDAVITVYSTTGR